MRSPSGRLGVDADSSVRFEIRSAPVQGVSERPMLKGGERGQVGRTKRFWTRPRLARITALSLGSG